MLAGFSVQGDAAIDAINADVVTVDNARIAAEASIDSYRVAAQSSINADVSAVDSYRLSAKSAIDYDVATVDNEKDTAITSINSNKTIVQQAADSVDVLVDELTSNYNLTPAFDFADGFTIQTRNQAGKDASGNYWIYNGSLPFVVTAATVPSSPDYKQVTFNNSDNISTVDGNLTGSLKIRATDEALWGDRFVGYFADGFVYASDSDIAKGSDGNYYRYIGASAYPVTVTAGTDESGSNYALVNASQKKEFKTVSDAINYVNINSLLGSKISTVEYHDGKGYGGSNYEVVLTSSVTPNGMDIIQSTSKSDYSIKLIVDLSCNITNFGFKTDDVTSDAGIYIQRMVDSGAYKIAEHVLPSGIVYWGTTVLSHAIPLKLTGKGSQRTEVIPSSSCQFDTNRIPVEVDLPLEYECNALIVITRFNGESNNSTSTQRDIDIGGFSYNASGTAFERQVGIIFAGGISHSGWHDIYHTAADYVYFAKNMSDGDSRHFYVTFKKCRGQDSNSQVDTDWSKSISVQQGSTWLFEDCAGGKYRKSPYNIKGVLYSNAINSSADNVYKGNYVWDIQDSNINLTGCAVESRYEFRGDVNTGSGLIRALDSDVVVSGGNYIGGDDADDGTGSISDYDDGSGNVADSLVVCESTGSGSSITFLNAQINIRSGASQSDRYPVVVKGNRSVARYITTYNLWQSSDLACQDGGKGLVFDIDGDIILKDETSQRVISKSAISTNNELLISQTGDDRANYDLFSLASSGLLLPGIYYRVNIANLGGDLTDINWPTSAAGFGVASYILTGTYGYIEVQQTNGDMWRATTTNLGVSFSNWKLISYNP